MRNKLYHKHINLKDNFYFLDYVQLYFKLPLEDLKLLEGYNLEDCRIWLRKTAIDIFDQITRNNIEGIRIGAPRQPADLINYGIKIYFEGSFFEGQNIKQDVLKLKKWANRIQTQIIESQYTPNSWNIQSRKFLNEFCTMKFPPLYVSRVDLSQNLMHSDYPKGLHNNSFDTYLHRGMMKSKDCVDITYKDVSSGTVTGHTVGNKKHVSCNVYNKVYDDKGHTHALQRFKTINFWRREWRVQKRKIKSMKFNLLSEFYLLVDTDFQKQFIRGIRSSVDIVLADDKSNYNIFHFTHLDRDLYHSIKDDTIRMSEKVKYMLSECHKTNKPISERKVALWDGVANVLGIVKNYKDRWSHDDWVKILKELLSQPDRLPFFNNPNVKTVDIEKVKNFLSELSYR